MTSLQMEWLRGVGLICRSPGYGRQATCRGAMHVVAEVYGRRHARRTHRVRQLAVELDSCIEGGGKVEVRAVAATQHRHVDGCSCGDQRYGLVVAMSYRDRHKRQRSPFLDWTRGNKTAFVPSCHAVAVLAMPRNKAVTVLRPDATRAAGGTGSTEIWHGFPFIQC